MSLGDQRCDGCGSKELHPFMGRALCLCRRCAGSFVQMLLRYIRGFDRDHPRPKKPKNQALPVTDLFGGARCRGCEAQMPDWKAGEPPYCTNCEAEPRAPSAGRSVHERVHPWGPDAAHPPALHQPKP